MFLRSKVKGAVLPLFFILLTSLLSLNPSPANAATCATGGTCVIGDTGPGGGVVFFVRSTYTGTSITTPEGQTRTTSLTIQELADLPFDYLEAAPAGWDATAPLTDPGITFANDIDSSIYNQITGSKIGTGKTNTDQIVALYPSDSASNNAGIRVTNATINGKSDWWLPSEDELILMYTNLYKATPRMGEWEPSNINAHYRSSTRSQLLYFREGAGREGRLVISAGTLEYVKPIRGFSVGASIPNTQSEEDIKREAERQRQRDIGISRTNLINKIKNNGLITPKDLSEADLPIVSGNLLSLANEEMAKKNLGNLLGVNEIHNVLMKYKLYDQVSGTQPGVVRARDLVTYGVIPESTPEKTRLVARLMEKPIEDRDTIAKIDAFVAANTAEYEARKERLATILKKIQSRRN